MKLNLRVIVWFIKYESLSWHELCKYEPPIPSGSLRAHIESLPLCLKTYLLPMWQRVCCKPIPSDLIWIWSKLICYLIHWKLIKLICRLPTSCPILYTACPPCDVEWQSPVLLPAWWSERELWDSSHAWPCLQATSSGHSVCNTLKHNTIASMDGYQGLHWDTDTMLTRTSMSYHHRTRMLLSPWFVDLHCSWPWWSYFLR